MSPSAEPPMFPAACLNPSCRHSFSAGGDGPLSCPSCGGSTVARQDVVATLEPDLPPPSPAVASTLGGDEDPSVADTGPSSAPARLGRFVLDRTVGQGAFGEVYRAHDPQLDRVVALKVAKPGTLDSPERVGRFLREARAAANLRHPHIVPVYDSGVDGGRHFIASGFIDGRTLAAEIDDADGKPLDLRRAADVVRKLAEALGYAHRQGVVHRDVKPANVLVDAAGEPSLTDFGLAIRDGDEAVKTQDGKVLGTPAYMSPEQAAGHSADATAASDQYALGVMLYEMATGRRPFDGRLEVVLAQQVHAMPARPRSENRAIPKDLETVILKCLEKEPGTRYANCEALADDLRRFLAGEPVAARRIGPLERTARWARRNPAVAASLAVAFLALVAGTAVSLWQRDEARFQEQQAETRAGELSVALGEKTKAEEDASGKAVSLAAETRKLHDALDDANRNLSNSKVLQAFAVWEKGDAARTRAILEQIPPASRRWEWHYLLRQTDGGLYALTGHTGAVQAVTFSPQGDRLATGAMDRSARLWCARTGRPLAVLNGHDKAVMDVAFSPDGATLATASLDGTARVWDARTGAFVRALKCGESSVGSVAFASDGAHLLTATGRLAHVWNLRSGTAVVLDGHRDSVNQACFSPDGTRVVTASEDRMAKVWDARTGRALHVLEGHTEGVRAAAFSPDGATVATASEDETARLWSLRLGSHVVLRGHTEYLSAVAFSPDGVRVATASLDRTARVWDAHSGQPLATLRGHGDNVLSVAFSPDGMRVATAGLDKTARVWDARSGQPLSVLKGQTDRLWKAVFSPDGVLLAAAGVDRQPRVWDTAPDVASGSHAVRLDNDSNDTILSARGTLVAFGDGKLARVADADTGRTVWALSGHEKNAIVLGFSADERRLLTSGEEGAVRVWDLTVGACEAVLGGHVGTFPSASFSPDASRVVTATDDGSVRVWEVGSRAEPTTLAGSAGSPSAVAFSPDGYRVLVSGADDTTRVWKVRAGELVASFRGHSGCFSPDGRRVATLSGNAVAVWETNTGGLVRQSGDLRAKVFEAKFSPDGACVLVRYDGDTASVWWLLSGNRIDLNGHSEGIRSAAFSPDGERVITGSGDNTVRVWDVRTGVCVAAFAVPEWVDAVGFVRDGHAVALCRGWLRVWDGRPSAALPHERKYARVQPRPEWHADEGTRLAGEPFARAVQLSLEQHARGLLVIEALDFDKAQSHFLAAALLKPKPRRWLEPALPPRPVR